MDKVISFSKKHWKLLLAVAYLLIPVDLVPDFLPVLGVSDDVLVLILTLVMEYLQYRKTFKTPTTSSFNKNSKNVKDGEIVE